MGVRCLKCGAALPWDQDAFGSPATGYQHPFSCPPVPLGLRVWHRAQQVAAAAAMVAVALTVGITLARLVVYLWGQQ